MPAPTVTPADRDPADVPPAARYPTGSRAWVWRDGAWRPAVVLHACASAALVRYRLTVTGRATGADTVPLDCMWPDRAELDPMVDAEGGGDQCEQS